MTGVAIVIPMLNEAAGLPRLSRSLAALEPQLFHACPDRSKIVSGAGPGHVSSHRLSDGLHAHCYVLGSLKQNNQH